MRTGKPMVILRSNTGLAYIAVGLGTFLFFFSVFLAIKGLHPDRLSTLDDPYFHARYAAELALGRVFPPPVYSSLNWFGGGDLWYGYHYGLAWFMRLFQAYDTPQGMIFASKLYHAVLAACALSVIALVALRNVRALGIPMRRALGWAFFAVLMTFVMFPLFTQRIAFERPHLLAIPLFLLAVDGLRRQSALQVFLAAITTVFFYSFSIILVIPLVVHGACLVLTRRRMLELGVTRVGPLVAGFLGLFVGVMLLPHPLHYVINAWGVPLLSIFHSTIGMPQAPAELRSLHHNASLILPLAALVISLLVHAVLYIKKHDTRGLYWMIHMLSLIPIAVMYVRGAEYIAPVTTIGFVVAWCALGPLSLKGNAALLTKAQAAALRAPLVALVGLGAFMVTSSTIAIAEGSDIRGYPQAFLALSASAQEGDRVLVTTFAGYTLGSFYAPNLRYIQGVDPTFTYLYDPGVFWLIATLRRDPARICEERVCDGRYTTVADFMRTRINTRFVLTYCDHESGTKACSGSYTTLVEHLSHDQAFTRVYAYEEDGKRSIYLFMLR